MNRRRKADVLGSLPEPANSLHEVSLEGHTGKLPEPGRLNLQNASTAAPANHVRIRVNGGTRDRSGATFPPESIDRIALGVSAMPSYA